MRKSFNSTLVVFGLLMLFFSQSEKYQTPPKTHELLFYIQRNHNANTIIYDANYDANGRLIKDEPIIVYWRRYDEQGQKMELRTIEKWYAYGVDFEKTAFENTYKIILVADKERSFTLKQISAFKTVVYTVIDGKQSVMDHLYIYADNSGAWPTVKYIELFGIDAKTKQITYEKIIVD